MSQINRNMGLVGNVAMKAPVRLASTSNIANLNGLLTVDGVVTAAGDRVLLTAQTSGIDNGIYVADTGDWERDVDCDGVLDLVYGTLIKVNSGTANSGFWYCSTTTDPIEVGSTSIAFAMASSTLAVISAFMQTVLDDTTAVAARTTLGAAASGANTDITSLSAPALGAATATTPSAGDSDTSVATTAFVTDSLSLVPQGRITLTTGLSVTTADVTGATTVFYTPHNGAKVPIYNGTRFIPTVFAEISQLTTDTTKSPAAVAASKVYDLFVWSDAGTIRCTRGPLWSTNTARGTGAGTTELQMINGIWTNKVAITNGPGANLGTYVGTIESNASSQINDSQALRNVFNYYNEVDRSMVNFLTADRTTTSAIYVEINSEIRCGFTVGLAKDAQQFTAFGKCDNGGASNAMEFSMGFDGATPEESYTLAQTAGNGGFCLSVAKPDVGIGSHFVTLLAKVAGGTLSVEGNATKGTRSAISGIVRG